MDDSIAGVVLAAGAGTRLAPLTRLRPKALCPVGDRPLVDLALDRLATVGLAGPSGVAVNAHHGQGRLVEHVTGRVHVSVERPVALGTAGAIGALRDWADGRAVLVTNADAWLDEPDLAGFVAGWDGERTRLLVVDDPDRGDFGAGRYCGVALLPAAVVAGLVAEPSGLYEVSWGRLWAAGALDLVTHARGFVDCGSPADYLAANLAASGGATVVGEGAVVEAGAVLERCVVWPGVEVHPNARLVDAICADARLTVLVR